MKANRNSGVAIVEAILVLVFVGLLGGLGYVYLSNSSKTDSIASQDASQAGSASVEEVSNIESTADLDSAIKELDSLDIEDGSDDSSLKSIESSL